jgi:hypothetical protein
VALLRFEHNVAKAAAAAAAELACSEASSLAFNPATLQFTSDKPHVLK